jgi:UV DNA damage endonuclease
MIRLGLCCKFHEEPIRFRSATATALLRLPRHQALQKLAEICLENAQALEQAIRFCRDHRIGAFRINSQILPAFTHPDAGYRVSDLPDADKIAAQFQRCAHAAQNLEVRLSFHPDQFVLLSSPHERVTRSAIDELEYQAEVAEWVSADVINIHGGGVYGNKPAALERFQRNLQRLSDRVRSRLTVENDDRSYSPGDLLPLCRSEALPLVYDVHHHRCLPDALNLQEATDQALATWNREPLFHISSPKEGWDGPRPQRHHDYIDWRDFPDCWKKLDLTVEVEAKAKELAVEQLRQQLEMTVPDKTC